MEKRGEMGKKKEKKERKKSFPYFSLFFLFFLFLPFSLFFFPSCASIGNPTGGEYDTIPPVFLRSNPAPNTIFFKGNKIELFFNEYISIDKPSEKVIITPPQIKMPTIRALGKKIEIELKDSLILNTTYTFDFTNAIVDSNEGNAIEGFTFALSTGGMIDSLIVSGIVLNAENLEPMPNTMVGLHSDVADSAFTTLSFVRTSMTNDRGQFWIRNIASGTYRLFALNDQNRNFKFDQVTEDIAFFDSLITPGVISSTRMDTIRIDSLTIDTIKETRYDRFYPDNIALYLFKEQAEKQYLSKTERPTENQLIMRFNSDQGLPPTIYLLDDYLPTDSLSIWYIPEYSPDKKDITYWITDSLIYKRDTIRLEVDYLFSDSLNNLVQVTDTLRFVFRNQEAPKKDNQKENRIRTDLLKIDITTKSIMDVFDTLKIVFAEPVIDPDFDKILIQQKVDTLWENRKFPIVRDTLNPRTFYVDHTWYYEQEYRITIDSTAFFSIYNKWNDSIVAPFKFNSEKEYGNLYVNISGDEGPGFGELLDASDKVVRKSALENEELVFEDLKPGNYFLRYIVDTNENGKWDAGNYAERLQPEKVYYFHNAFTITKFGEHVQEWDIRQLPIEKQKPLEITKNKPVEKQPRRNEQQEQNQQRNTGGSNSPGGGAIPGFGGRSFPGM